MDWVRNEYPNIVYILEVKYSGDITITEARCKEYPREKDNSKGFTSNYLTYEQAKKDAHFIAKELNIKCGF